jgi:hypothetical protein
MTRTALLPLALLALTSITACGDDDDDAGAATVETTEATTEDTTEATTEDRTEATAATTGETTEPTTDGTGADTDDTTGTASGDDSEICAALRVISETDRRTNELLGTNGDFDEIKEFFADETPEVLEAYDRVAAAEPELAGAAETLRAFTEESAGVIEEAEGIDDFIPKILELPNVVEAGSAGLELNSYAEENCGFSTGNQAAG